MPGCGKSYWAQKLSQKINISWIDLDQEIEKVEMLLIAEIFETKDENYFRETEKNVLHKLSCLENLILATGGGTPCFHDNMKWMNKHGITIWIDEPVQILFKRLKNEKANRPLIKNLSDEQLKNFLSQKLKERFLFYSQAKYHLKKENISEKKFDEILKLHT